MVHGPVRCPRCGCFQPAASAAPGQRIRCVRCHQFFNVGTQGPPVSGSRASPPPGSPASARLPGSETIAPPGGPAAKGSSAGSGTADPGPRILQAAGQKESESRGDQARPAPGSLTRADIEIHGQIGHGGMGVVLRGYCPRTREPVAIKMLGSRFASHPRFAPRFQREIQLMSNPRLAECPYLVKYLGHHMDVEACEYLLFIEYLNGGTLRDRMKNGLMPLDETKRILSQVCKGLSWLHIHGIVHRDIKPENVLFDAAGTARLTDLGLAKIVFGNRMAQTLTQTRTVMGTYFYMSPEQRADSKHVGLSSDIFSVGVMLYEMLTGTLPVGAARPVSELCPYKLPAKMDQAIFKMIAADPKDRYQTAEDVAWVFRTMLGDYWWVDRDHRSWTSHIPVKPEEPPSPVPPVDVELPPPVELPVVDEPVPEPEPPPERRRRPWTAVLAAFAGVVGLVVLAVLAIGHSSSNFPVKGGAPGSVRPPATAGSPTSEPSSEAISGSEASYDRARSDAFASMCTVARRANWHAVSHNGQIPQEASLFGGEGVPADSWDTPLRLDPRQRLVGSAGPDRKWGTADDLRVALWREREIARAQVEILCGHPPAGEESAPGSRATDEQIARWLDPWSRPIQIFGPFVVSLGPDGKPSGDDVLEQRTDGELLAFARRTQAETGIWLADPGGRWEIPLTFGPGSSRLPRWSPDGRQIAFVQSDAVGHEVRTVRPDRQAMRTICRLPSGRSPLEIRWLNGGSTLLLVLDSPSGGDLGLAFVSVDRGATTDLELPARRRLALSPAVNQEGTRMAFVTSGLPPSSDVEVSIHDASGTRIGAAIALPEATPLAVWFRWGRSAVVAVQQSSRGRTATEIDFGTGRVSSVSWSVSVPFEGGGEGPGGTLFIVTRIRGFRALQRSLGCAGPVRALFGDEVERFDPDVAVCRMP